MSGRRAGGWCHSVAALRHPIPAPSVRKSRCGGRAFQGLVAGLCCAAVAAGVVQPGLLGHTYVSNSISKLGDASAFEDPAKYAHLFVRCGQTPAARRNAIGACQMPGGDPIANVESDIFQNRGDVDANGFDFQLSWISGAISDLGATYTGVKGLMSAKYEF